MALLILPNLTARDLVPFMGGKFTARELGELVGGALAELLTDRVYPLEAFGDELAMAKHLPHNRLGSLILGYPVLGPVLLIRPEERG